MHNYQHDDLLLSKQDIATLELYRKRWSHPSVKWTGEYRPGNHRFVVTAVGSVRESDGKVYAASLYHNDKQWQMLGRAALLALSGQYPELMKHFFPEQSDE